MSSEVMERQGCGCVCVCACLKVFSVTNHTLHLHVSMTRCVFDVKKTVIYV